jgi:hypothetical protein
MSKTDLMVDTASEEGYVPFLTNRALSYFPDTILYAQEMNINTHLDKKLQYHYLINTVRKSKRFSKWNKKKEDKDIELIQQHYGYNYNRAKEALSILSNNQLKEIRKRQEKGG